MVGRTIEQGYGFESEFDEAAGDDGGDGEGDGVESPPEKPIESLFASVISRVFTGGVVGISSTTIAGISAKLNPYLVSLTKILSGTRFSFHFFPVHISPVPPKGRDKGKGGIEENNNRFSHLDQTSADDVFLPDTHGTGVGDISSSIMTAHDPN